MGHAAVGIRPFLRSNSPFRGPSARTGSRVCAAVCYQFSGRDAADRRRCERASRKNAYTNEHRRRCGDSNSSSKISKYNDATSAAEASLVICRARRGERRPRGPAARRPRRPVAEELRAKDARRAPAVPRPTPGRQSRTRQGEFAEPLQEARDTTVSASFRPFLARTRQPFAYF